MDRAGAASGSPTVKSANSNSQGRRFASRGRDDPAPTVEVISKSEEVWCNEVDEILLQSKAMIKTKDFSHD